MRNFFFSIRNIFDPQYKQRRCNGKCSVSSEGRQNQWAHVNRREEFLRDPSRRDLSTTPNLPKRGSNPCIAPRTFMGAGFNLVWVRAVRGPRVTTDRFHHQRLCQVVADLPVTVWETCS